MGVLTCPCDEILAGARNTGADGAHAHAGNLGRLLIGITQYLGEDEGFAAVGREGVDKRTRVDPLAPRRGVFRRRTHRVFVLRGRLSRPGHIVANIIHPHAPGQGEQPRARGGTGGETRQGADDTQIGLLGEIVSPLGPAQVRQQAPHIILGGFDKLRQRRAVAATGPKGEVGDAGVVCCGVVSHLNESTSTPYSLWRALTTVQGFATLEGTDPELPGGIND